MAKFIEFSGMVMNIDQLKISEKDTDRKCIEIKTNPETGNTEEVITGKPYRIVLDFGDGVIVKFTYSSPDERDANYERLISGLEVINRS